MTDKIKIELTPRQLETMQKMSSAMRGALCEKLDQIEQAQCYLRTALNAEYNAEGHDLYNLNKVAIAGIGNSIARTDEILGLLAAASIDPDEVMDIIKKAGAGRK